MIAWCISAVLVPVSVLGAPPDSPFASMTFAEACVAAGERDRLVLVYFSEADNEQCTTYRKLTWTDRTVTAWLAERVTAIEITSKEDSELRQRFDVRVIPTVVVVSPDGTVRARVIGFREPQALLKELEPSLQASDSLTLARRRLESHEDDPAARLAYAKALEEAGYLDEALRQYLHCFNQDNEQRTGTGGRQLVVLAELGRLAARHPPAHNALVRQRDAARTRLMRGAAAATDPAVFAAANTQLGELEDTISVYKRLHEASPESLVTRLLRECAVDSALSLQQYKRITELLDPVAYADQAYRHYRRDVTRPIPPSAEYENFQALARKAFVERMVKSYEMLVGMERREDAAAVASTLMKVDDSVETHLALAVAALRTGRPSEADARFAHRAVELAEPPEVRAISTLVEILIHLGYHDDAARVVEEYAPRLEDERERRALEALVGQ